MIQPPGKATAGLALAVEHLGDKRAAEMPHRAARPLAAQGAQAVFDS